MRWSSVSIAGARRSRSQKSDQNAPSVFPSTLIGMQTPLRIVALPHEDPKLKMTSYTPELGHAAELLDQHGVRVIGSALQPQTCAGIQMRVAI